MLLTSQECLWIPARNPSCFVSHWWRQSRWVLFYSCYWLPLLSVTCHPATRLTCFFFSPLKLQSPCFIFFGDFSSWNCSHFSLDLFGNEINKTSIERYVWVHEIPRASVSSERRGGCIQTPISIEVHLSTVVKLFECCNVAISHFGMNKVESNLGSKVVSKSVFTHQ